MHHTQGKFVLISDSQVNEINIFKLNDSWPLLQCDSHFWSLGSNAIMYLLSFGQLLLVLSPGGPTVIVQTSSGDNG